MIEMLVSITISLVISCGVALTLAILVARQPQRAAARPFIVLMIGVTIWSLGNLIENANSNLTIRLLAVQFEYIGIVLIPMSWLLLTLEYTGHGSWITKSRVVLLAVIPIATIILAWTNSQHHLLWQLVPLKVDASGAYWQTVYQPIFWVHAIYSYGLLLAGNIILIEFALSNPKYYQSPIYFLVAAITLPTITNLLYVAGIYRPFQMDPTPALFVLSGVVIAWVLFHRRLFDHLPITFNTVINNLSAAIIVIDANDGIVNYNRAAQDLLGEDDCLQAGCFLEKLTAPVPNLYKVFSLARESQHEVIWQHDQNQKYYEMQVKQLQDEGAQTIGYILINHEISAYINTQKALEESELKYRTLFESAGESILIEDLDGKILDCNSAAVDIFGYSRQKIQAIHVTDLVPEEVKDELLEEYANVLKGNLVYKESQGKKRDGSIFPSEVRSQLLTISGEQRMIVHVRDITEQKAAEQKTKERLAITETLYEISRSLISAGTLDTALESILAKVTQILDCDRVSLILLDLQQEQVIKQYAGGQGADLIIPIPYEEVMEGLSGWCLRQAQPAISNGCETDPRESVRVQARRQATQCGSILVAPLICQTRKLGTVTSIKRPDQDSFTPQDQELLVAIANQAAIAIQNAQLLEQSIKRAQEADTLRQATSAVVSTLDQDEAIERILEQLEKVIPYDSASVQIYENNELIIIGGRGWRTDQTIIGLRFPVPGDNPNTIVIETRQPYWSGNAPDQFISMQAAPHQGIRSWMGVPLIVHDRLIGMLVLDHNQADYYTEENARLVSSFADQVAIAIENVRMYTAEQQRVQQLDALRATMTDISSELELSKLLRAILVRAIDMLNASGGDLALYQEFQNDVLIVASHNMGLDYTGTRLEIGEGVLGKVAESLQPLVVTDYPAWPGRSLNFPNDVWHAVLATPLLIAGRLLGCIGIVDINPQRKFSQEDQRLLNLFAQQAAIAVENARLYQSAKEAAERRAVLHRISQEIVAANLEPESIYYAIHKASSQLTVCESFVISLVNEAQAEIEAVYLVDKGGRSPSLRAPFGQGLSSYVIKTGRSLNIPDLTNPATPVQGIHFGSKETVRSVLAVPMRLGKQIIGVISTQSYKPHAYSSEDQYLMEMLASYAAIALSNTHLFQTIQQLAKTDPLTGIFNRRHLFELGQREFFRAVRFNRPMAAIMIDIDHFKRVNDNFGHATGDEVLIELAQRMQSIIRDVDILARYGGEEFTILVPEISIQAASVIAERIRKEISYKPFSAKGFLFNITVSIGIAGNISETANLGDLIELADKALYDAKHLGRNQTAVRDQIASVEIKLPVHR